MANTITGKVTATRHAGTSSMGNPSYDVTIAHGRPEYGETITLRTSSNAGIAYGITNSEYREHAHTFELSRAGRITGATVAEPCSVAGRVHHSSDVSVVHRGTRGGDVLCGYHASTLNG